MSEPIRQPGRAPESYTPKKPEIASLMQEHAGKGDTTEMPLQKGAPEMFTTERLIVRHFQSEDWRDVLELAISKENDAFADCDHPWPTSEDEIQGATNYFATNDNMWAFELKSEKKVICFANFNSFHEGTLDIGHVVNARYLHQGLVEEGLTVLFTHAFTEMGAQFIRSTWAYADKEKLTPLYHLNMKVIEKFQGNKFSPGSAEQFEACRVEVSKEDFSTQKSSSD